MPIVKRFAAAALIPVAGIVTLGCGSSVATTTPKTSSPPTTAAGSTTTAPLSAPTTTSTVAITPTSDQCMASQLQPSWLGMGNGASGHLYYGVNLLNSSPTSCVTGGYVGVSAYSPAGDLIAANESRDSMGMSSPPTLTVATGASVHFVVGLPDVVEATGGTECSTTVGALHLIPPNETSEVQIAHSDQCGIPQTVRRFFPGWSVAGRCDRKLTEVSHNAGSAAVIDLVRLTTQAATLRNLCHGDPRGSTSSDDQAACGANVAIPTTGAFR